MQSILDQKPTLEISFEPFQSGFIESVARFPAFMAGWGTGKTLCAIAKGLDLSVRFPGNYGLIARKKFTDLRDSTMKDFTRYTGLHVPQSTKEVTIPGTDSVIIFRHAEELSGLQNVNLGWYYLEQAEEFDTDEQFQLLRGRMRRVVTPIADVQAEICAMGVIKCKFGDNIYRLRAQKEIVNDYNVLQVPIHDESGKEIMIWDDILNRERKLKELDVAEYAITAYMDLPVRQGIIIGNKAGHNWIWKIWKKNSNKDPDYDLHEAETLENIDNLPTDFLHDLSKMETESPRKWKRFVKNSWDEYDIEGAFYAVMLSEAIKEKRTEIKNMYDQHAQVYTFWDLGVSDSTVIWAVQFIGHEIHIINYYENTGEGLNHYVNILQNWGYSYAEHYLPQDVKARMQGKEVVTRLKILTDLMKGMGALRIVYHPHTIIERIEEVWRVLGKCWFDEKTEDGLEGLTHYRKQVLESISTEKKISYSDKPLHDWASHPADAFGYMAIAYRYQITKDGVRIGVTQPNLASEEYVTAGKDEYDYKKHGFR